MVQDVLLYLGKFPIRYLGTLLSDLRYFYFTIYIWLPDRNRLPAAFRQIPDDAAFLHWHKNSSYHYAGSHAHSNFSPPSCFLQHDVLSIFVCLVYIDIPEIVKQHLGCIFSILEIVVDFIANIRYNAYRKFK